jgi:osmotically-inducible protein OsmY
MGTRNDTALSAHEIYEALWDNDLLRSLEYGHITVRVAGNTVILDGHVTAAHARRWAEETVASVPGVEAIEDHLVDDDQIVVEVCLALARDPRTADETVLVAARHGVVVLSGAVASATSRQAAEERAASVGLVRGVSNYIEAPGVVVRDEAELVLQPQIHEEVIATDMAVGRVADVIISPHNRRVSGLVVEGRFPYPVSRNHRWDWDAYDVPTVERSVVIPSKAIAELTPTAVWLAVSATEAANNPDFDLECYRSPGSSWLPPYPYRPSEVWLDGRGN